MGYSAILKLVKMSRYLKKDKITLCLVHNIAAHILISSLNENDEEEEREFEQPEIELNKSGAFELLNVIY